MIIDDHPNMASSLRETGSWRASVSFRTFSEKRANRYFQPIYFSGCTTYHIEFQVTHYIFQLYNLYLPHRKLYIRNFQPIYNTVQHIFRDTTYILVFNTFATLGVPYTVKGHKFRRWKTNAGNTPGKTKRFFVFKSLLCLPLINGCLITSRMARNINNHSYFYKKKKNTSTHFFLSGRDKEICKVS